MNKKKVGAAAGATIAALVFGIGVAEAASSGSYNFSESSNTVIGTYNFYANAKKMGGATHYDTDVAGRFYVTNPSAHLNVRNDGYGYKTIINRSYKATVPYHWYVLNPDVMVAGSVSVQNCKDRIIDSCTTRQYKR